MFCICCELIDAVVQPPRYLGLESLVSSAVVVAVVALEANILLVCYCTAVYQYSYSHPFVVVVLSFFLPCDI